jgi:LysM repeat protein
MPDYKPNQIVRVFAVLALIAALVLVVVVIVTTGGGSSGDGGGNAQKSHISKEGRRALHRGVWIVHPGDTLGRISLKTGVPVDTLVQLNQDVDPQTLLQGQQIKLTASSGESGGGNRGTQTKPAPTLSSRGQAAVSSGVWIVRSGDTLTSISHETRIPITTLVQLNPDLNPQTLTEGQRIALR